MRMKGRTRKVCSAVNSGHNRKAANEGMTRGERSKDSKEVKRYGTVGEGRRSKARLGYLR